MFASRGRQGLTGEKDEGASQVMGQLCMNLPLKEGPHLQALPGT